MKYLLIFYISVCYVRMRAFDIFIYIRIYINIYCKINI
ncbi:hypothetical protein SAMN04487851_1282 [Prevotella sp. tc2-28]|nr:hypothetical protein SAMN04487851_1282 [Prevotella sp. tc2-28]